MLPVTRFYYKGWIGAVVYGAAIDDGRQLEKWGLPVDHSTSKRGYVRLGTTSGFDDTTRDLISSSIDNMRYNVITLKAMEVIDKTGALRHPRFVGFRHDKTLVTLSDYINS
jgi:hypothetical protein